MCSSEGNLVYELDEKNPTQLLLDAIEKQKIVFANDSLHKDNEEFSLATFEDDNMEQVCSFHDA